MTLTDLRRAGLHRTDGDDATLLRRAGRGDRRAHRLYSRRHAERAVELVELLVGADGDAAALSAQVLSEAIAGGVAGDDALVRCAVRIAAPLTTESGLARLVAALSDGDGRTDDEIATLIDRPDREVSELRSLAYADVGPAPVKPRECRGWPLVARKDRLTDAERAAADGHLTLCRQCRVRLAEQRNRDKIWLRGGAVSTVVLADVVSLSLPAGGAVAGTGFASVVLGKAGMAIVGATALAVTATSAGVAVARSSPSQPHRSPVPSVRTQHPGDGSPSSPASHPGEGTTTGSLTGGATTASAPPSKTQSPHLSPAPTAVPSAVPSISVPVHLPTLPPLPLPSISVSVPPLPLPTGSSLLGH